MDNTQLRERIFPFVWPWRGLNNEKITILEALALRKFSLIYLLIIWGIVGMLDFASTRNCTETWQLALQCEYAFWVKNYSEAPLIFVRNLFTTMFLHNGLDHILFVTVIGVVIVLQSYEARYGFKKAFIMFYMAYWTVAPGFGAFYTYGLAFWPENEFFQFAFARNWMGGSLGLFLLWGALAWSSKKPYIFLSVVVVFEIINFFVLDIDPHISLMHLVSTAFGFGIQKIIGVK